MRFFCFGGTGFELEQRLAGNSATAMKSHRHNTPYYPNKKAHLSVRFFLFIFFTLLSDIQNKANGMEARPPQFRGICRRVD